MKTIIYTLITISTLALSVNAFAAGEGGVAASASFQMTGGVVTNSSVAMSVGKTTAYAGATTDFADGNTEAFAVGTGGILTLATGSVYLDNIAEETVTGLAVAQANVLATSTTDINAVTGVTSQNVTTP